MVIIGHKRDEVFLLDLGDGKGQILDLPRKTLWWPTPMSSLTSQAAPWYDYTGPQERLADLLAQVKPAPPPPPPPPEYEAFRKHLDALHAELKAKGEL